MRTGILARAPYGALFHRCTKSNRRETKNAIPDFSRKPQIIRMKYYTLRSARSEVPGQQTTEQAYFIIPWNTQEVGAWSVAWWGGWWWDVSAPPIMRDSRSKHTRHWTLQVKRRPPSFSLMEGGPNGSVLQALDTTRVSPTMLEQVPVEHWVALYKSWEQEGGAVWP